MRHTSIELFHGRDSPVSLPSLVKRRSETEGITDFHCCVELFEGDFGGSDMVQPGDRHYSL